MLVRLIVSSGCLLWACASLAGEPKVAVARDESAVRLSVGGRAVAVYRFGGVPFKPYVAELRTPGGINVLRDAPHDHLHHHALMFALSADGVDFWAETAKCGSQAQRGIEATASGMQAELDWKNADGQVVLVESRSVAAHALDGVSLITWRTSLAPAKGRASVKLTGEHYFGLGMRLPETMEKATQFLLADPQPKGELVRGDEWVRSSAWVAAQGMVDGKPVTVALFDHPDNPRHPNRIFTMNNPFAYQSMTLNLYKEPMTLEAGKPLKLAYGVAAWDSAVGHEMIQKQYEQWLKLSAQDK